MKQGWKPSFTSESVSHHWFGKSNNQTISLAVTALDPLFWQSLGKALEWERYNRCPACSRVPSPASGPFDEWHYHALYFYDLILTGGDTQAFWDDLLGK